MIILTYNINTTFGYDANIDAEISRFMQARGFSDVGSGTGFGERDLEFSASRDIESAFHADQSLLSEISKRVKLRCCHLASEDD